MIIMPMKEIAHAQARRLGCELGAKTESRACAGFYQKTLLLVSATSLGLNTTCVKVK